MKKLIVSLIILATLGGCIPFLVADYVNEKHEAEYHDAGMNDAGP